MGKVHSVPLEYESETEVPPINLDVLREEGSKRQIMKLMSPRGWNPREKKESVQDGLKSPRSRGLLNFAPLPEISINELQLGENIGWGATGVCHD
jgi:hypothetical protein